MRINHIDRHRGGSQCKTIICRICNEIVPYLNRKMHQDTHTSDNTPLHRELVSLSELSESEYKIDEDFKDIYLTFSRYIKAYIRQGRLTTVFNCQLDEFSCEFIENLMSRIYHGQSNSFKINISISYILKNIETNEFCFYWSSQNNQLLFDTPKLIHSDEDYRAFSEQILELDLQKHVCYPNTKYTFVKATNVTFYLTKLIGVAIGSLPASKLPNFLRNNKGLNALVTSNKTGKAYTDNLCFFRCLALFLGFKIDALESEAKSLLKQFSNHISMRVCDYKGICLDQLEVASQLFAIGINVYQQEEDRKTELIFRSIKQQNIMYLNLYEEHFSYIKDFNKYSSSYCCPSCGKIWTHHGDFKKHIKVCDGATKEIYTNGIFRLPETIFEQLAAVGVDIPTDLRYYDHKICFDIEATLSRDTGVANTDKVNFINIHKLASISVCSNVPSFTSPRCFVSDGCPRELVKKAVKYMHEIAAEAYDLQHEKFVEYIPQIDLLDDQRLQDRFDEYLMQVPVLTFNGI